MSKLNSFLTLFAASVIVGLPAYSQEDLNRRKSQSKAWVALPKRRRNPGLRQSTTNSGGVSGGIPVLLHQAPRRGSQLRLHSEHAELSHDDRHNRHQELLA